MLLHDYFKVIHRISTGYTHVIHNHLPYISALTASTLAAICGKAYNIDGVGLDINVVSSDPTGLIFKTMQHLEKTLDIRALFIEEPSPVKLYNNRERATLVVSKRISFFSGNSMTNHHRREYLKAAYKSSGLGNVVKKKIRDKLRTLEGVSCSHLLLVRDSNYARTHLQKGQDAYYNRYIIPCERVGEDETFDLDATIVPPVPLDLAAWLSALQSISRALEDAGRVVNVEFASSVRKYFDEELDKRWNDTNSGMKVETYVKIKKLAALFAVGRNFTTPIISKSDVDDALAILNAERDFLKMDLTTPEEISEAQESEVVRILDRFFDKPHSMTMSRFSKKELHAYGITPISHVICCCKSSSLFFKTDTRAVKDSVHAAIKTLVSRGVLEVIPSPFKFKDAGSVVGGFVYLTSRHQEKRQEWAHLVGK